MDPVQIEAAARRAVEHVRGGTGAVLPRVPHLPLPRAFDVRHPGLPHARRDRGLEAARPDRAAARLDGRQPPAQRRRGGGASTPRSTAEIDAAVAFAEAGTLEPVDELERFVLMDEVVQERAVHDAAPLRMTYREACRQAIRDALRADPRRFVHGRGRRQVRRLLRGDQGPARGVRPRAHRRHAAGRERLHRRRRSARRWPACGRSSRS